MNQRLLVVESMLAPEDDDSDMRGDDAWTFCLEQRMFGPRRTIVTYMNAEGRLLGLSHCRRTEPPWQGMGCCMDHFARSPAAAIVYNDEPVRWGPPPSELAAQFAYARMIATGYGIHLVDWFACDDQMFRSTRVALDPNSEWWDVPA